MQKHIKSIAKARNNGERYIKTGGQPLTSNDFFKAFKIPRREREREIKAVEKDRAHWMAFEEHKKAAVEFLCQPRSMIWLGKQLDYFLNWYQVPRDSKVRVSMAMKANW